MNKNELIANLTWGCTVGNTPHIEFPLGFGRIYGDVIYAGTPVCSAQELEDLLIEMKAELENPGTNEGEPPDKWGL